MERFTTLARAQLRGLTAQWPRLTIHVAIGVMFLCLAVFFAALCGHFGGITWLLVWPAYSLVVVGLGYVWLGPGVVGKQPDGTLSWRTALTLMPYLGASEFAWYMMRVLGDEEPWHEISRGLYLGRRVDHWELPARIAAVLDLTAEFVEPLELRTVRRYVSLPVLDASVPSVDALASAIEELIPCQGSIYVHCAAGYGRSAMAMAVLLVARGIAHDIDDAVRMMRAARPRVRLRTTQYKVAAVAVERLRDRKVIV